MYRIKKVFKGYPFAHRQHNHDGHCSFVHGHNWDFEVALKSEQLDQNGFIYDFGKFGWLKDWLEHNFDHTCLINQGDPYINTFRKMNEEGLIDLREVKSCSSEGLAEMVYKYIEQELTKDKECQKRGVQVSYVCIYEDYKNSAQYVG